MIPGRPVSGLNETDTSARSISSSFNGASAGPCTDTKTLVLVPAENFAEPSGCFRIAFQVRRMPPRALITCWVLKGLSSRGFLSSGLLLEDGMSENPEREKVIADARGTWTRKHV